VGCRLVAEATAPKCSITISHETIPLLIVIFDSSIGKSTTDREFLGSFGLFDDVVVSVKWEDSSDSYPKESVAIPIICLDKDKPSDLVINFVSIEVSITFEAQVGMYRKVHHDIQEQTIDEIIDQSRLTSFSKINKESAPRRGKLVICTKDIYTMLKLMSQDATSSQVQRLKKAIRVVKLLVYYLMEGCHLVSLVVIDLSTECMQLLDQLVLVLLESVDAGLEFTQQLLTEDIFLFVKALKYRLLARNSTSGMASRVLAAFAGPPVRLSWRLTKMALQAGCFIASPVTHRLPVSIKNNPMLSIDLNGGIEAIDLLVEP
jgi:hypothetical protein